MRLPRIFKRAAPAANVDGFTNQVITAQEAAAWGLAAAPAARGACIQCYERAGQLLDADHELLTGASLAGMMADLGRSGNSYWLIDGRQLLRATAASIIGGPRAQRYRLTIAGPSETETVEVGAAQVIAPRIHATAEMPWLGRSPIAASGFAAEAAQLLERAIRDAGRTPVTSLVEWGADLKDDQSRGVSGEMNLWGGGQLRVAARPTVDGDRASPANVLRVQPELPAANVEARRQLSAAIAAAYGLAPSFIGADASAAGPRVREDRIWVGEWTLQALALVLEEEASRKLGGVKISRHRMKDNLQIKSRALAAAAAVEGISTEQALRIAGLEAA